MFARFRRVESHLQVRVQVSLAENRRVDGRIRGAHIAALGSVGDPATIAERVAFAIIRRLTSDVGYGIEFSDPSSGILP